MRCVDQKGGQGKDVVKWGGGGRTTRKCNISVEKRNVSPLRDTLSTMEQALKNYN